MPFIRLNPKRNRTSEPRARSNQPSNLAVGSEVWISHARAVFCGTRKSGSSARCPSTDTTAFAPARRPGVVGVLMISRTGLRNPATKPKMHPRRRAYIVLNICGAIVLLVSLSFMPVLKHSHRQSPDGHFQVIVRTQPIYALIPIM